MNMIVRGSAALAAAPAIAHATANSDAALLDLERRIFEQHAAARGYDDEIHRLGTFVQSEAKRLYDEALANEIRQQQYLTPEERWARASAMPELDEQKRLEELQEVHWVEFDKLVEEMWETPAHSPEGREAKFWVLISCIMPVDFRAHDEKTGYEQKRARDLMIEFVGGEPAKRIRDQFA